MQDDQSGTGNGPGGSGGPRGGVPPDGSATPWRRADETACFGDDQRGDTVSFGRGEDSPGTGTGQDQPGRAGSGHQLPAGNYGQPAGRATLPGPGSRRPGPASQAGQLRSAGGWAAEGCGQPG